MELKGQDTIRVNSRSLYYSLLEQGVDVVRTSPHGCIGNADVWDDKPEVEDERREEDGA
jgi:hypothetical protein